MHVKAYFVKLVEYVKVACQFDEGVEFKVCKGEDGWVEGKVCDCGFEMLEGGDCSSSALV